MNKLKFWQAVLVVLWVFALGVGGYYLHHSYSSPQNCDLYLQTSSSDCSRILGDATFGSSSEYDLTSPLRKQLLDH